MSKTKLPGLQKNVPLAQYTTFRIGGPAKYFYVAKNEDDIVRAVEWAQTENLDYAILGEGSNLLVSDNGFSGLVIKNENIDFKIEDNKIYAGSGINLGFFVSQCAASSLTGAEFLVGIPGTAGGAVRGNAGAWGKGAGSLVDSVKVLAGGKIKKLSQLACRFSYRGSLIKKKNYIILSIVFVLQKGIKEEIQETIDSYFKKRAFSYQPKDFSAGCTFKNIDLKKVKSEKIKTGLDISEKKFAEITKYGKLPVGYLIEKLDLKGKKIGGAEVSPRHGNFIISNDTATASDIIQLISYIKEEVRNKTGVQLEEEVQYLGF